ncbi:MAG: DNA/RNA non-specific endonuclease [Bacteroidetes bacterium]|nr:DNA/RNA non-specific endonuclease [Bacteroidota bacterium]
MDKTKMILRLFAALCLAAVLSAQNTGSRSAVHLLMGNPDGAEPSAAAQRKYLMMKEQFALSYDRMTGIPNWVAWHTDSSWLGEVRRSNDFRADSTLPEQWYRVHEASYRRSGYDRGHMCPSGDRTNTQYDNSMTFLMTNMIPQAPNNNQGPWAQLEIYCRELVQQGKELYIYCGGNGEQGFLDSGRVQIPLRTWKAVLVLDAGEDDLRRVTDAARTIAVVMPNSNALIGKNDDWRSFRVTIDSVEALTGFDLFSRLPHSVQTAIERRTDAE